MPLGFTKSDILMGTWNIKIVWVFWHDVLVSFPISEIACTCLCMFLQIMKLFCSAVFSSHSALFPQVFHARNWNDQQADLHQLISWLVWYIFLALLYIFAKHLYIKQTYNALNTISISSTDHEGLTELEELDQGMLCRNKQKPEESVGPLSTPFRVSREQLQQFITTILCLPRPQKAQGPIAVKFNVAIRHKSSFTRPDEQVAILRASLLFCRWYK